MVKSMIPGIPKIMIFESRLCCCFQVSCGTLIIGYFGLILSLCELFIIPILFTQLNVLQQLIPFEIEKLFPHLTGLWIVAIVTLYINLLLIKGLLNDKPKLMLPWIYAAYIILIILSLVYIVAAFIFFKEATTQSDEIFQYIIGSLVTALLFIVFCWYCFFVVVSHCQDLLYFQKNGLDRYKQPYSCSYELHNY